MKQPLTYQQKLSKKIASDQRNRERYLAKPRKVPARAPKQPSKRVKKPKPVKLPVTQILRDYGLPEKVARWGRKGLKYESNIEKSVYWFFFSNVRKMEDLLKYGTCVSCGRTITELDDKANAGHYVPTANCGFTLVFHPLNVSLECAYCNGFDEGHLIGYGFELDKRYGEGTARKLLQMKQQTTKEWTTLEYRAKIPEMRERYTQLLSQLP